MSATTDQAASLSPLQWDAASIKIRAYSRAFAAARVDVPDCLLLELPRPVAEATRAELHHLLALASEKEATLLRVRALLQQDPHDWVSAQYVPLIDSGRKAAVAVRDYLLFELRRRADDVAATPPRASTR